MQLFSDFNIRNVSFKNRIVMSPMCMYSCVEQDGKITDWHQVHYASRAQGQVGLIIVEATAVQPEGRISPQDLGIWTDEHVVGLTKLVDLIHENGTKAGIQIAHAGRKALTGERAMAPSAIPFDEQMDTPMEMTLGDIEQTKEAFIAAADRAKQAGFDVIELHAAHGYLLNEFLSPLTNKRTDDYGGSSENRYRLLGEIIAGVRERWDGPLFVRISAEEYHPDGNHLADYVAYSKQMKTQGVDLIDCSSGGVVPYPIEVYPGYQVPLAETIRREVDIPTGTVGLITSGRQAEEVLRNGRADLVLLGRELLRDPYWVHTAAQELGVDIEAPKQYRRSWGVR